MKKITGIILFVLAVGSVCAGEDVSAGDSEPRIQIGGDLRFRMLYEDDRKLNGTEAGNDRLWQRYRARVWTSVDLTPDVEFNLRLATEPRHYNHPAPEDEWIRKETLFDRFNLKFNNVLNLPLQLTVGRQAIEFADRWLVGEGTPEDGTRSDHFDAVRTRWTFAEQRATVDLIWIEQRRDSAAWLPPINDVDLDNRSQDERGIIVWLSKEVADSKFADGYFIYKKDFHGEGTLKSVNGESFTFGLRSYGKTTENLSYNAEVVPQFGHKNGKDYSAFAVNSWLQWTGAGSLGSSVRLGYEYLSGDRDPEKHFDKLWGREGLWSDLYTGGIDGFDGRSLDSSNLHRPHIIVAIFPAEKFKLKAEYSLLFADETVDGADPAKVDNGSKFRGQHLKASLEQQLTDRVKHYVTIQTMIPGNYYSSSRQDAATWFRYGVEYKF